MNARHYLFFPEKNRQCLILLIEYRSQSDCVHEQVAKRIANVHFTYIRDVRAFFKHALGSKGILPTPLCKHRWGNDLGTLILYKIVYLIFLKNTRYM